MFLCLKHTELIFVMNFVSYKKKNVIFCIYFRNMTDFRHFIFDGIRRRMCDIQFKPTKIKDVTEKLGTTMKTLIKMIETCDR